MVNLFISQNFPHYFNYRGNIAERPLNRAWCNKPAGNVEFSSQQFLQ